jgi:hypothetical protein
LAAKLEKRVLARAYSVGMTLGDDIQQAILTHPDRV